MDQLLREFLADADDLIEALFNDIRMLREKQAEAEAHARRELTGRIFRRVHTIKGTAAAAGLETASRIAHEFETLLDGIRRGRVEVREPVLDAFEDGAHALSQTFMAAARGETSTLPIELLENLRHLAESSSRTPNQHASHHNPAATSATSATSGATSALLPAELENFLSADETRRVHEAVAVGQRLFVVHVRFELEDFAVGFRELSAALSRSGELISTLPGATEAAPGAINLRLLYAAETNEEELRSQVSLFGSLSIEGLKPETIEELKPESAGHSVSSATEFAGERDAAPFDDASTTDTTLARAVAPLAMQVRVELGKLDALISDAHELMTQTGAALRLALENVATGALRDGLEERATIIQRRSVELEEQLISLRRVPLAQTLERAARVGRQAARAVGKEVIFAIEGGETLLDKSLVEAVSDPLLHLVRNAVSHGIEAQEERLNAGKSASGTVRLEALAEGDRVILSITDDGRGIDLESIARAAVRRGLIEDGRSVTHHQAMRLIFSPGFSTATVVSKMAGRGVGLDVVERAVEQLGGEMRVWSATARATTFEMVVPVALALSSALVVSSSGHSYCVDSGHIAETCMVAPEDIRRVGDEETLDREGEKLPLVRLRRLLGQPAFDEGAEQQPPQHQRWHVIIVTMLKGVAEAEPGASSVRAAIAVQVDDWSEGRAEVLVRRLGAHAAHWQGIRGAAELANGELALVLDLPRLLEIEGSGR